jgi:hypothetical protein
MVHTDGAAPFDLFGDSVLCAATPALAAEIAATIKAV